MDKSLAMTSLVESLKIILCRENRGGRKYADAWLTEEDFGGLYRDDKYILNVKATHRIDSCFEETGYIIRKIHEHLQAEQVEKIWRAVVYNADDEVHCWTMDDIHIPLAEAVC